MLPYRLRPHLYGKKLKKDKELQEKNGESIPTNEEGPVRDAIQRDLLNLQPQFQRTLGAHRSQPKQPASQPSVASKDASRLPTTHSDEGDAFSEFRTVVFSDAKASLPQTLFSPPRSDRGHHAQLIYGVCLQLIQNALRGGPSNLDSAYYGMFCLFALAESDRLMRGHINIADKKETLVLLSMDMQTTENPKLRFRRTFCHPIQIDRFYFTLLLLLREEVVAIHSDCENQQVQLRKDELQKRRTRTRTRNSLNVNGTPTKESELASNGWSCRCGGFCDVVHALRGAFSRVSLSSSAGPCCLEALAGYIHHQPLRTNSGREEESESFMARGCQIAEHLDIPVEDTMAEIEPSSSFSPHASILASEVENYLSCLLFTETPGKYSHSNLEWLKKTFAPSIRISERSLKKLTSMCRSILSGETPLPAVPVVKDATREEDRRTSEKDAVAKSKSICHGLTNNKKKSEAFMLKQELSYDVVLPTRISLSLQNGIQHALHYVLNREAPSFLPAGDVATAPAKRRHSLGGESHGASDNGIGGLSSEQHSHPGHGGTALEALMSKVIPPESAIDDVVGEDSVEQSSHPGYGGTALGALMSKAGLHDSSYGGVNGEHCSEQSSHPGNYGGTALGALMSKAMPDTSTTGDSIGGPCSVPGHGRTALGALISKALPPESTAGGSIGGHSFEHGSHPGHGGAALGALMSKALPQATTKFGPVRSKTRELPHQVDFLVADDYCGAAPFAIGDCAGETEQSELDEDQDDMHVAAAWNQARSNRTSVPVKSRGSSARNQSRVCSSETNDRVAHPQRRKKSKQTSRSRKRVREDEADHPSLGGSGGRRKLNTNMDKRHTVDDEQSFASSVECQGKAAIEMLLAQVEEA